MTVRTIEKVAKSRVTMIATMVEEMILTTSMMMTNMHKASVTKGYDKVIEEFGSAVEESDNEKDSYEGKAQDVGMDQLRASSGFTVNRGLASICATIMCLLFNILH